MYDKFQVVMLPRKCKGAGYLDGKKGAFGVYPFPDDRSPEEWQANLEIACTKAGWCKIEHEGWLYYYYPGSALSYRYPLETKKRRLLKQRSSL